MVKIIKFQDEQEVLIKLIEELQDYLIQLDPLKRLHRLPGYGKSYTANLLKKIENQEGIIYIAEIEGTAIGMIAGIIEKQSPGDELECIPSKAGRILELIVSEKLRGQNIGSLLMQTIEKYFLDQSCDIIRVEVFEPNTNTHNFYKKLEYHDRVIDMVKKIS
ncbi:MAG: GNAT family N-acetyltransferase [Candidatus Parcubacteria bacterium]|nr:GNAT family N-acetyltransferase [Candidatus Parcubacteria bacterium]